MKWIDIAFGGVFLTNVIFMVGAALALVRILNATQSSSGHLREVIGESIDVTKDLKRASKRMMADLDKIAQEAFHRETSAGKSLITMSRQIADLQDLLHERLAEPVPANADAPNAQDKGVTQRLRDKLREVLEKNMKLQLELDMTSNKLRSAIKSHDEIIESVQEMKGVHPQAVKELGLRTEQLKLELSMANTRAVSAERLASENAERLLDLQSAFNSNRFGQSASDSMQLDTLQQQNQAMANRERELLSMLDAVKAELQRNITEKDFIEDRFVELDTRISEDYH